MILALAACLFATLSASGCSSSEAPALATDPTCTPQTHCTFIPAGTTEDSVQDTFARAKEGQTLKFGPGVFAFRNELTVAVNGVSVVGAGIDQTTLDFAGQVSASEGLFAQTVKNVRLEGFTIKDTKGNGVKVLGSEGVIFRKLKVLWTGDDATTHGGYGLYPVQSKSVLIEDCIATGASDSGIYVGQSQGVVVRRNEAFGNVAGIEIENTFFADVYENDTHDNTGGLLVFDLPELQQLGGHGIRVFDNKIHDNNTHNFAPQGNIVGLVPAGTGFFVMANADVEIFRNTFTNNHTGHCAVVSYYVSQLAIKDPKYYPYPTNVFIHDNTFVSGGTMPDLGNQLGFLLITALDKFPGKVVPEILYDGITDPMKVDPPTNPMHLCVKQPGAHLANLHFEKLDVNKPDLASIVVVDPPDYDCALPATPPVSFPGVEAK